MVLPVCVAAIEHVPALTRVMVVTETVQTNGVVEAKVTVRPDDAVALSAGGAVPRVCAAMVPKVMVWVVRVETTNVWVTGVAAA